MGYVYPEYIAPMLRQEFLDKAFREACQTDGANLEAGLCTWVDLEYLAFAVSRMLLDAGVRRACSPHMRSVAAMKNTEPKL